MQIAFRAWCHAVGRTNFPTFGTPPAATVSQTLRAGEMRDTVAHPDLPALPDGYEYKTIRLFTGTNDPPRGFLSWETLPFSGP